MSCGRASPPGRRNFVAPPIAGYAALFAAIPHEEVRQNYWFVFHSERMDTMWILASEEFHRDADTNKTGKNIGLKSIWFNEHRKNRVTNAKEEYCKPRWMKYVSTDFSRIANDAWEHREISRPAFDSSGPP